MKSNGMKATSKPAPSVRHSILLVEDDPYVAKFIKKRLSAEGFEVIERSNGEEALEVLNAGTVPDLILSFKCPRLTALAC